MIYEERYVTLPSNGGGAEFPNNTNSKYQVRLITPFLLEGNGWEVALTSITFPSNPLKNTTTANILKKFPTGTPLASKYCYTEWESENRSAPYRETTNSKVFAEDVADGQYPIKDGITFVRALINALDDKVTKDRIKQPVDPTQVGDVYKNPRWIKNARVMEQVFEFDANHTLIIHPAGRYYEDLCDVGFHEDLAKAWGIADKDGKIPGPSTRLRYRDQNVRYKALDTHADGVTLSLTNGDTHKWCTLKAHVRWEIMNMNSGWFESTFLPESKTLRVYSNVGESRLVGNQRVDLLREVRLDGLQQGQQYVEPRHLEYVPVRRRAFEVMEIHIDDLYGGTADFGSGVTSVTLHFRRRLAGF